MNEKRQASNRPAEVQLGNRPVESTQAPANGFPNNPWPAGPAFPNPIRLSEADRRQCVDDPTLGTPEWSAPTEKILESYQGTVVVIEVGKDGSLPARPDVPSKI